MTPDERRRRFKFGQNFLVDENVIHQIASDVPLNPTDWVLEIGPGQGAITRQLAKRCRSLTAIEIDPKWVEHLRGKSSLANVEVIEADATRIDVAALLERFPQKPVVVGNLPYNRAAPILMNFLPHLRHFRSMNIMVQYEVAKRIAARPHSRDFGFLSVYVQNYAEPTLLLKIGPDAFRPRPKVLSATVHLRPLENPQIEDPVFLKFVELAFSQKRKVLTNSLQPFYARVRVAEALGHLRISPQVRAEDLSVAQFIELYRELGPPPAVARVKAALEREEEDGPGREGEEGQETGDGAEEPGEDDEEK